MQDSLLSRYLDECRALVREEIQALIPSRRYRPILYELMLEYPLRAAKALRPSLCIAVCRALGGRLQDVLRSAAVLELFHNAFLIHDDIEDGSELRRGKPTLHQEYGVPIAINVGDGMLALSLQPLLDNTRLLGLGRALKVMQIIARMSRESVEGQALELEWVRRGRWDLRDGDYLRMVHKKTGWYTFVAPVVIGGIIAGVPPQRLAVLRRFATYLGVAFQIQDDVLNLDADEARYGKEIAGDLWEGKRTLLLLHALRAMPQEEREEANRILARPRAEKRAAEVAWLLEAIQRRGGARYARQVAGRYAGRAREMLARADGWLSPSTHRDFIGGLIDYVIQRDR
jgi:geranylgeranyl diphosphate synthase type II